MKFKFIKKLSLLDYFVIFIILFGIAFSLRFLTRKQKVVFLHTETGSPEWSEEQFPSFYWLSNSIRKGDSIYTASGTQVGEVVDVYNVEWRGNRRYSRLKLKLNAIFDKRTGQYRIDDVSLMIGSEAQFNIENTAYKGQITYIGETPDPLNYDERYLKVEIKVPSVESWLAETYNESFVTKSTDGREVFRITDSRIEPAAVTEVNSRGSRVYTRDPLFKDIYIEATMFVTCQSDVCYFNGTMPIKVGLPITIQSPESTIEGYKIAKAFIMKIEELSEDSNLEGLQ